MSISDLSDVFFFPNDVIAQSIVENVREIKLKGMYETGGFRMNLKLSYRYCNNYCQLMVVYILC